VRAFRGLIKRIIEEDYNTRQSKYILYIMWRKTPSKNIAGCGERFGVGPALPASQLSLERLPHPLTG
jgi:hypothetical protein